MIIHLTISDKIKLIDELIAADQDATIKIYLDEVKEIEDEINNIQQ